MPQIGKNAKHVQKYCGVLRKILVCAVTSGRMKAYWKTAFFYYDKYYTYLQMTPVIRIPLGHEKYANSGNILITGVICIYMLSSHMVGTIYRVLLGVSRSEVARYLYI